MSAASLNKMINRANREPSSAIIRKRRCDRWGGGSRFALLIHLLRQNHEYPLGRDTRGLRGGADLRGWAAAPPIPHQSRRYMCRPRYSRVLPGAVPDRLSRCFIGGLAFSKRSSHANHVLN